MKLDLPTDGSKKVMAKRYVEAKQHEQDTLSVADEIRSLARELYHNDTIVGLKDAEFRTLRDLVALAKSLSFPSNMDFIRLTQDRALLIEELVSSVQQRPSSVVIVPPKGPQPAVEPETFAGISRRTGLLTQLSTMEMTRDRSTPTICVLLKGS